MSRLIQWWNRWISARKFAAARPALEQIRERRAQIAGEPDTALATLAAQVRARLAAEEPPQELAIETFALVDEACRRALDLQPFDVQLAAALAMQAGHIAEMQTGEGKTLVAVFPATLYALEGRGVHVLTVNDYLARRDAEWMGGVYQLLGLRAAYVGEGTPPAARRDAYAAEVTYGTANEIGFDYLRDHLRRDPSELVQRPFHAAVVDEADSILIDEARIPLVIAGGAEAQASLPYRMAELAARLSPGRDYTRDQYGRNVQLTEAGARQVERITGCGNLYDPPNLALLTTLNHALHARELLRRDVDYLVKNGAIEMVDEFKGRIAENRRWPDGLQAAVEAKEGLGLQREGRVLASLTLQNLIDLYPRVCGMTATALTQAEEFKQVYDLEVVAIPTNRPPVRVDHPDIVFTHRRAKELALIDEIRAVHATGRPILVGTASVAESERLGHALSLEHIAHEILNARNDEAEARIIAQAGALGAVTISTNMAGRGTDILLGGDPPRDRETILALGGLLVIGTNKHESRRIDNQLRGRAGRQGDPGSSCFFVSLEDDLIQRFGIYDLLPPHYRRLRSPAPLSDPLLAREIERVQTIVESQNLEIRRTLWKYEGILEKQRRVVYHRRRAILLGETPAWVAGRAPERWTEIEERFGAELASRVERQIALAKIDELWSEYLASVTEIRDGVRWQSFSGFDPLMKFRAAVVELFDVFFERLERETVETFVNAAITGNGIDAGKEGLLDTSSTWTYLINDQPFGDFTERMHANIKRIFRAAVGLAGHGLVSI